MMAGYESSDSSKTNGVYIGDNKRDYSGYDQENWQERNLSEHRRQAINYTQAQTKSEQKLIESEYGIRYSALLELPYFDPIRFAVVDPMHNLYLGSGKHAIQVWIDQGILTKKHFIEIEQIVSKFKTPQNTGRIPLKIASGFSGFTADQWQNWIVNFSPVCLKGILPTNHLRCWLLFVQACRLLCTRIITVEAIDQADKYLLQFCKQFQLLYGSEILYTSYASPPTFEGSSSRLWPSSQLLVLWV